MKVILKMIYLMDMENTHVNFIIIVDIILVVKNAVKGKKQI